MAIEPRDRAGQAPDPIDYATVIHRLTDWTVSGMGLHPGGSNYVFVAKLEPDGGREADPADADAGPVYAIYKPAAGERPLRDFPHGTLHNRERAAYRLSRSLGWPLIPPTVVRNGPHGVGSMQLFIDADAHTNYFSLRESCLEIFAPVAMFDVLVHNADRKGGACLMDSGNRLWAIDHGLTFNPYARRRTVMFEFNGEPYPRPLAASLRNALPELDRGCPLGDELRELLSEDEVSSLRSRAEQMLDRGRFPLLDPNVNVPWPFI